MSSSRVLDDGSSQYLKHAAAVVASYPMTFACWVKSDDLTIDQTLISISDASETQHFHRLRAAGNVGGDPIVAFSRGTAAAQASTSSGYSSGVWHHVAAVFTNSTDREAFIDGGSRGFDNTDTTPSNLDTTMIGAMEHSGIDQFMSGKIALVGIWSVALSDAEVAQLAGGALPTDVQAANLEAYYFDGTEVDTDHENSFDLTPSGGPTWDSGDFPIAPGGNVPTAHIQGPLYGPLGGPI